MVIQSLEQLTPEVLTELLRQEGSLQQGSVRRIEDISALLNQGYVSNVASLKIVYTSQAAGDLPGRLFLKMSKPDVHPEILSRNRHEVNFYRAASKMGASLDIPHCYSAEVDDEGRTHLLLADYTETHIQKPLPIPPSDRHCERIVACLARLHARWWNHPRLGQELGTRLTEAQAREIRVRLEKSYPAFVDFLGDALLPAQRAIYEKILSSSYLPRIEKRVIDQANITLVHGDTHTGNFLLPGDVGPQEVILIDWHLWNIHMATNDLAFFMALHWPPQRRAILERPLVKEYHRHLVQSGGVSYPFEDVWNDYRLSVILTTLIPIGQHRRNQPAGVIWFGLQDSMAAFKDLDCEELL